MKPRNREINIFNMSLLDVLCGALGAFCFLMLVLFPFYSQDKGQAKAPDVPPQPAADPQSMADAMNRIHQLEDLVKKFQDYAAQLDAQNKRQQAESRQMQGDLKKAEDRNDQLEMRKPLLAVGRFAVSDGDFVQVYVEDNRETTNGTKAPKADPTKGQDRTFNGDFSVFGEGAGLSYFMVRDTPESTEYHVVLKIIKHKDSDPPIRGYVAMEVQGQFEVTPTLIASKEHTVIPLAVLSVDKDRKQVIKQVVPKEAIVPSQPAGDPTKK